MLRGSTLIQGNCSALDLHQIQSNGLSMTVECLLIICVMSALMRSWVDTASWWFWIDAATLRAYICCRDAGIVVPTGLPHPTTTTTTTTHPPFPHILGLGGTFFSENLHLLLPPLSLSRSLTHSLLHTLTQSLIRSLTRSRSHTTSLNWNI